MASKSTVPQKIFKFRTLWELFAWGISELKPLGAGESRESAQRLLEEATGFSPSRLALESEKRPTARISKKFFAWIERRKAREPVAYITGRAYFWNEVLAVGKSCLIPRPETEILIEKFIEKSGFKKSDKFSFLDLAAGTGAIGVSLLREFPKAQATFSDISRAALRIVRKNIDRYDLGARAKIVCSDLLEAFKKRSGTRWDAILCNPPYLTQADFKRAQPEILLEPRLALAGGQDGLDFYRRSAKAAPDFLNTKGFLIFEVGIHQAKPVRAMLRKAGFRRTEIFKDYGGIDRVVLGQK